MIYPRPMLLILLQMLAGCRAYGIPVRIETAHQFLDMREDGALAIRAKSAEQPIVPRCVLKLTDGRSKTDIALLSQTAPRLENESLVFQQIDREDTLAVRHRLKPLPDAFLWQITIRARGKEARRLRVQARMETTLRGPCKYWDGLRVHELGAQPVNHAEVNNSTFPLAALYNETQGVAVGLAADQFLSHAETSAQPGESAVLSYGAKVVVDPARPEDVVLVLYPFTPDFGHLDAVEAYYRRFPDFFQPYSGIDPRVVNGMDALGHSHGAFWQLAPHSEILRRCGAGFEWCFAPFKRCGDHYGEDELWNFDGLKGHNLQAYPQWRMAAEPYRQQRQADLAQGGKSNQAMLFYVANAAEEQLARVRFEESLIQPLSHFGTWPYETEYRVFPAGGAFGRKFESDLTRLAAENEISGFAYDSGGGMGTRKYRGPLGREAGPQAWDDEGGFVLEGVAMARNMDFMHRRPVLGGRYQGACMVNPGGEHPVPYMMIFRADRGMVEWPSINAYKPETVELLARYRMLMGQKPISMHASLRSDKFGSTINWQSYSPEQITRLYQSLWRHEVVAGLHFGILPGVERLWGVPEMFAIQRMLLDLIARGHRATSAVKLKPDNALVSRYGLGLRTVLAFGNASQAMADSEAAVLGRHLDDQATLLFSEYGGGEFRALAGENTTRFRLHLEPQNWLALEAVARIATADRVQYAAREQRTFYRGCITIENLGDGAIQGEFTPRIPAGYRIEEVRVGDQALPDVRAPTRPIALPSRGRIVVAYRSTVVGAPDEDIRKFPFVRDGKPACVIVLPPNPDADTRLAAAWIQGYFAFWHRFGREPAQEISLPIVEAPAAPKDRPRVELRTGDPASIRLAGGNLVFTAADSWALKDLVWKHLALFDAEHPYYGRFHADMKLWLDRDRFDYDPDTVAMLTAVGLLGKNRMLNLDLQRSPKTALPYE